MTRAVATVQEMSRAGITPSFGAAPPIVDGFSFVNDGREFIEVKNAGGTQCNVSIKIPGKVDGSAVADKTVTVPITTGDKIIGPFPPNIFNNPDGTVYVNMDFITSVTYAVFRMPY